MSRPSPHPARAALLLWVGLALALGLPLLGGCTPVRYVLQAGCGQLELSLGARPLSDVLADPATPPRTAALLREVPSMKRFGERHGLTPTNNYAEFVNLGRAAAVWVVTASEPLRFRAKSWSFPVVGSVTYLGWFDRGDAQMFADELSFEGWDVDLRGASAYSTLGWFDEPVLSTMIPGGDEALGELANVVLHESVHATIYIKGQTRLNENIASFIGDRLAEAYLDEHRGPESLEKEAYLRGEREGERRARAMHAAYVRLAALYDSALPDAQKLAQKAQILAELRAEIGLRRPVTNATLAQFKTYTSSKAELSALLASCGGSYRRLLAALRRIRPETFAGPQERDLAAVIMPLVLAGCGGA
jgi:predicted aminopeptidase